jgi:AAA domain-containing protein
MSRHGLAPSSAWRHCGGAHSALATNRITMKQRELSEAVVTGTLDAKLREELHNLRGEHLPVVLHPHTAVGETQVALRLAGAHGAPQVSDIASEGEQRVLSLSFFLAEVATSEDDGGIVVVDPVSSLDDERRAYIAERLVGEAQRRQVIVLTHDLPFMLDLIEQAENAGIEPKVQGVWRLGHEVGRVDDHPAPSTVGRVVASRASSSAARMASGSPSRRAVASEAARSVPQGEIWPAHEGWEIRVKRVRRASERAARIERSVRLPRTAPRARPAGAAPISGGVVGATPSR